MRVSAEQRHGERTAQERPVHEVICVVPPVDGVVKVECVPDRVDQERKYEQHVNHVRVRRTPTTRGPDHRHEESRDRVAHEPPAERFPSKLLEARECAERRRNRSSETFTARSSQNASVRFTAIGERIVLRSWNPAPVLQLSGER